MSSTIVDYCMKIHVFCNTSSLAVINYGLRKLQERTDIVTEGDNLCYPTSLRSTPSVHPAATQNTVLF